MPHRLFPCRKVAPAIALAAALVCTGAAHAALVTVTFDGHLTSVPSQVASAFTAGETFTFHYTYLTTQSNAGSASNAIYYYQGSHLDIGGGSFTLDAPAGGSFANAVSIENLASFDAYIVDATDGLAYSPSGLISPYTLVQVFTQFSYAPTEFSGPALLPGAPPYTSANGFRLALRPNPASLDGQIFVEGSIDTATDDLPPASTPEPSTLALLLPALALVGRLRRSRDR